MTGADDRSDAERSSPGERGRDGTDPPEEPQRTWLRPEPVYPPGFGYSAGPSGTAPGRALPPAAAPGRSRPGQSVPGDRTPGHPSPGTPPWAYAPPAKSPRSVRSLGVAVQILLGLSALAGLVALVADGQQFALARRIADRPRSFRQAEADATDQFVRFSSLAWGVAMLATGIVFVVWFFRLRRNAGLWAPDGQRWGPGATIWGWLPIVNFWVPYRVAKDALRSTRPAGSTDQAGRGILRFWWTMWVLMVIGQGVDRILTQDLDEAADLNTYLDSLVRYSANMVLYDIVAAIGAVAAILAVRLLVAAHEDRLAAGSSAAGFEPWPPGYGASRKWSAGY